MDEFALLQENLAGQVLESVPLAPYTSFRIGGPAKYFYVARSPRQLFSAYALAQRLQLRCLVLGGGSNLVFADEGFNGLIIKNECRGFLVDGTSIAAQSGVSYDQLAEVAMSCGLSGLEFAAGIPGTVGGAVWGNAGAWGRSISDVLEVAVIGSAVSGIQIIGRDFFRFGYRHSCLKENPKLVLSVMIRLTPGEKTEIADKMLEYRQLRRMKHPTWEGSAGSVFKNIISPVPTPAGRLLEEAGVRGLKVGGAEVFEKHCNIIVNKGNASAKDVRELSELMRQRVWEKHHLLLEYEITFVEP